MCRKVEIDKTFLADFVLAAPAVLKCSGVILGLEEEMSASMTEAAQKTAEWALMASDYCANTLTHKGLLEILRENGDDSAALKAMTCLKAELGVFCKSPEEFKDAKRAAKDLFPKVKGEPQVELLMGDPEDSNVLADDLLEAIATGDETEEELKILKDLIKEEADKTKKPDAMSKLMDIVKKLVTPTPPAPYNEKVSLEDNILAFFDDLGSYGTIKVSDIMRESDLKLKEAVKLVRERHLRPRVQVFAAELTLNMLKGKK